MNIPTPIEIGQKFQAVLARIEEERAQESAAEKAKRQAEEENLREIRMKGKENRTTLNKLFGIWTSHKTALSDFLIEVFKGQSSGYCTIWKMLEHKEDDQGLKLFGGQISEHSFRPVQNHFPVYSFSRIGDSDFHICFLINSENMSVREFTFDCLKKVKILVLRQDRPFSDFKDILSGMTPADEELAMNEFKRLTDFDNFCDTIIRRYPLIFSNNK
jgi:hypothetical protein